MCGAETVSPGLRVNEMKFCAWSQRAILPDGVQSTGCTASGARWIVTSLHDTPTFAHKHQMQSPPFGECNENLPMLRTAISKIRNYTI